MIRTKIITKAPYGQGIDESINKFIDDHAKDYRFRLIDIKYQAVELDKSLYERALIVYDNDRLSQVVLYNDGAIKMKVEEAKAEAYKECIDKVKKLWGNYRGYDFERKLNNLLNELVGDKDEK